MTADMKHLSLVLEPTIRHELDKYIVACMTTHFYIQDLYVH